jgi:hypothetical protein
LRATNELANGDIVAFPRRRDETPEVVICLGHRH